MSSETPRCPVCYQNLQKSEYDGGGYFNSCPRCGEYRIGKIAAEIELTKRAITKKQRLGISFWLSNNSGAQIVSSNLKELLNLPIPTVEERSNKLLLSLSKSYPIPGTLIRIIQERDLPSRDHPPISFPGDGKIESINVKSLENLTHAQDGDELVFILNDYLCAEMGYASVTQKGIKITPKGWAFAERLKNGNYQSSIGFIAMSFNSKWNDLLSEIIEPAILEAGYEPRRIDKHDHNVDITDEIIALIRQCKFVVADFSDGNQGAYYEAGFARGLGREVFSLCREDRIKKLHFDTRQINHIIWSSDDFSKGRDALRNRIEAILGKGKNRNT